MKVFYDYYDGKIVPIWLVINTREIDWSSEVHIVYIHSPLEVYEREYFDENLLGMTILMSDLTRNSDINKEFGIYLPYVKKRAKEYGVDINKIDQLIIQVCDIEELLQMTIIRNSIETK